VVSDPVAALAVVLADRLLACRDAVAARGHEESCVRRLTAVLVHDVRLPALVYEVDLDRLRPGSLIVDVSCDEAGAIETSRPTTVADPIYVRRGIVHYAVDHTPSLYHRTASEAISGVVARFVSDLAEGRPNPVLEKATIIREGRILDERIARFQKRG